MSSEVTKSRPSPKHVEALRKIAAEKGGMWAVAVAEIDWLRQEVLQERRFAEAVVESRDAALLDRDENARFAARATDELAALREAARAVERRIVYSDTSQCWHLTPDPGQPALSTLRAVLSAAPVDKDGGER